MRKNIMLLFLIVVVLFPLNVNAVDATVEEQRQAVIETAHAYYRQQEQLQYDSYRKNLYATPEDATTNHYVYTVCSGLTFSVYYQTLGIAIPATTEELLEWAKANKNTAHVIRYYESASEINVTNVLGVNKDDDDSYRNFAKELVNVVLPGDIVVVTGHAMLVESIDYDNKIVNILEAGAGTRYNYTSHQDHYDEEGTLQYKRLTQKLSGYNNKIGTDNQIEELAIIRVITDGMQFINQNNEAIKYNGITEVAKSRMIYKDIDIEKTISISDSESSIFATLGDSLTFTLTIVNNSEQDYENLVITENINPMFNVINFENGTKGDNGITWSINLHGGDSWTTQYTIKIPNNRELLGRVISFTGNVNNIATSKVEVLISNKFDVDQTEKLKLTFNNLKSSDKIGQEFINQIYLDAFGINMNLNEYDFFDIISYKSDISVGGNESLSVKATEVKSLQDYIYHNFYGLRIGQKDVANQHIVKAFSQWNVYPTIELNDRARTIRPDMLMDGDIILAYIGNNNTEDPNLVNKSYIYLNNTLYRKTAADVFEEITGEQLVSFLRNIVGDNYIILRPAMSLNSAEPTVPSNPSQPEDSADEEQEDKETNPNTAVGIAASSVLIAITISATVYILSKNKIEKIN